MREAHSPTVSYVFSYSFPHPLFTFSDSVIHLSIQFNCSKLWSNYCAEALPSKYTKSRRKTQENSEDNKVLYIL